MSDTRDTATRIFDHYLARVHGADTPPDLTAQILTALREAEADGGGDVGDPVQADPDTTTHGDPTMPTDPTPARVTLPCVPATRQSRLLWLASSAAALLLVVAMIVMAIANDPDGGDRPLAPHTDAGDNNAEVKNPFELLRPDDADLSPEEAATDIDTLIDGHVDFAFDLLGRLPAEGNTVISPWSLTNAMALATSAATGETAQELAAAARLPRDADGNPLPAWRTGDALTAATARLHEHAPSRGEASELQIANSAWLSETNTFHSEWQQVVEERFGCSVRNAPFATAPREAIDRINRWVSDHTRGRITDIADGMVGPHTVAALINTVRFKGYWAAPFEPARTRNRDFHCGDGRTITVPMMEHSENLEIHRCDGWTMVELGFADWPEQALLAIPDSPTGDLTSFSRRTLERLLDNEVPLGAAQLFMPHINIACDTDVVAVLRQMGVGRAFTDAAAFDAMTPDEAHITDFRHRATLQADENGCEAAAASMVRFSSEAEVVPVVLDRPFLMLIRDRANGTILFAARINDPGTGINANSDD